VDSPTSKVVQVKVVNIVKGPRKTQFAMFCWSGREHGGGSRAICFEMRVQDLLSYTSTMARKLLREAKAKLYIGKKKWVVWNKAIEVNVSRPKADSTINQGRLMCRDANHIDSGIVGMLKEHGGQRLIAQLTKGA